MYELYQPNPIFSLISLIGIIILIVIFITTFIPALGFEDEVPRPNIARGVMIFLILAMYQGVI
jgi:hypothetical protein|tara:strand:- start:30973 stop:31161 length:189 start_codon:yes stop_codon:yes gene_type:complete